jgi:hypothetical protein
MPSLHFLQPELVFPAVADIWEKDEELFLQLRRRRDK